MHLCCGCILFRREVGLRIGRELIVVVMTKIILRLEQVLVTIVFGGVERGARESRAGGTSS